MQITRYLSLNDEQFLGCASAFTDALSGELNAALSCLTRLSDRRKGSAFAFEMQLDKHRYGALIVLERWAEFGRAFGDSTPIPMLREAPARAAAGQNLIEKANHVLDSAQIYSADLVDACRMAYQAVELTFQEEQRAASKLLTLGPMTPPDFEEFRRVFREDLAQR